MAVLVLDCNCKNNIFACCSWFFKCLVFCVDPVKDSNLFFSRWIVSSSLRPPRTAACQASLSFFISSSLLELMSIESMMPSSHLILCHPLLLLPLCLSKHQVFSSELDLCIRLPECWSFSLFNLWLPVSYSYLNKNCFLFSSGKLPSLPPSWNKSFWVATLFRRPLRAIWKQNT